MKTLRLSMTLVFGALLLASTCFAQELDQARLHKLTVAVARAEGFGKRHAIPTRYHNPGDLKANPCPKLGLTCKVKGVGKGGHIIFASDADGWRALEAQITLIASGQSKHYGQDATLRQVAKHYARGWKRWIRGVTKTLSVRDDVVLSDYVQYMPPPPMVTVEPDPTALAEILRAPSTALVLNSHEPTHLMATDAAASIFQVE